MNVSYLTMDSVQQGVGASQVLPYVVRLARLGATVTVHSFEPEGVAEGLRSSLDEAKVDWHPHRFGGDGTVGGIGRVLRGAASLPHASVLHARSDLAAASAILSRKRPWVWDVRSFWADQRIATGAMRAGSSVERAMRRIERHAASSSAAILTLSHAAIDELARRHGKAARQKARVVTTCVDLDRFTPTPFPGDEIKLLLSGSVNPLYDPSTMLRFAQRLDQLRPAQLALLRPRNTVWEEVDEMVVGAGGTVGSSTFEEMPGHIASHHAGLSVCHTSHPAAIAGAMPTKIGEFLASGRPVVVNTGLGDCDRLLVDSGTGVVLSGTDGTAIDDGCRALLSLLDDPGTPDRCRALAAEHFSLDAGVETLLQVYRSVAA